MSANHEQMPTCRALLGLYGLLMLGISCGSHRSSPGEPQAPVTPPLATPERATTAQPAPQQPGAGTSGLSFAADINPILQSACGPCHSKDSGLGLPAFVGEERAFLAYQVDVIRRITSTDPRIVMPLPGGGTTLAAADRDKIVNYLRAADGS